MEPGNDPYNNRIFMLTVAAVIRAVDVHGDLIRYSVGDASNDHRLGGHEAPPSIISVYLGEYIGDIVDAFADGKPAPASPPLDVDLGVPYLPQVKRDTSDRNRTNPFAFTGNKFEVRCVGASQHPAISNMILNTIAADAFDHLAAEAQRSLDAGLNVESAWREVVRKTLVKHRRVVFNGDGYTAEWELEAKKRGLPNFKTTPDVLKAAYTPKNIELFSKFKVLDKEEWKSRVVIAAARYCQNVKLEAQAIRMISDQYIVPSVVKYQNQLLSLGEHAPNDRIKEIRDLMNAAIGLSGELAKLSAKLDEMSSSAMDAGKEDNMDDDVNSALFAKDQVLPKMKELRKKLDALESVTDRTLWPLASYQEILHRKHN
jgi:glutamine synthetase